MFIDAAADAAVYPASSFISMSVANTALTMNFKSSVGGGTGAEHDSVALTIATGAPAELAAMTAMVEALSDDVKGRELVLVYDAVNAVGIAGISGCAITLDS